LLIFWSSFIVATPGCPPPGVHLLVQLHCSHSWTPTSWCSLFGSKSTWCHTWAPHLNSHHLVPTSLFSPPCFHTMVSNAWCPPFGFPPPGAHLLAPNSLFPPLCAHCLASTFYRDVIFPFQKSVFPHAELYRDLAAGYGVQWCSQHLNFSRLER
jgi:hypothetical protein